MRQTACTAGSRVPPAAPGSGCGSVADDTTVRNGVEPRQTAAGSRPFGPASLTRGSELASAEVRRCRAVGASGVPLTYWRAGDALRPIVIVGAPGTSVRFWLPLMEALRGSHSTLMVEYRGFPDEGRVLPPEELTVGRVADDLEAVLRAGGIEEFHLASWCLGAKLAWEILRRHPERALSVAAVGIAYRGEGEGADGPFARAMRGIRERVERDPGAAPALIRMMRLSGFVPEDAYFAGIRREPGDGAGEGGPASALPFHHNGTPCGLRNYLPMYEAFDRFRISHLFPQTRVPVTVVTGGEDRITPLEPASRAALDAIPGVRYETVEGASHYLPVEHPRRLAELLARHVERAASAPVPA